MGRVEILTGVVKQFKLGPAAMPVAAASSGGYVWVADQTEVGGSRSMYRFNEDGSYVTFALPKEIVVSDLVAGKDGNVWYVGAFPSGDTTKAGIGNMSPSGVGTLYPVTGPKPPVLASLASASNGDLWATDEQNGRLLDVTTGGKITPYAVGGHPHRITNSGHSLVYSDGKARQLSVITGGVAKVHPAPNGEYPGQLASRTDGVVVFVDRTNNNAAVNTFDPTGNVYGTEARAPNDGLRYLFTGPDRNTWFGDNYGNVGAYLKFDLATDPASIALGSTKCSASFKATETNYTGTLTVQSGNDDIATVTPSSGPSGTTFSVSSKEVGSTSIFVADSMQNAVNVAVTVSHTCGTPDRGD